MAAELYRVHPPVTAPVAVLFGICTVVPTAIAIAAGLYWFDPRIATLAAIGLIWGGLMVTRRLHRKPNIVLIGLASEEVVVLRATFLAATWKVLDQVGRWPLSDVRAARGSEVLALKLHPPAQEPLNVQPLAVTHDASQIAAALLEGP